MHSAGISPGLGTLESHTGQGSKAFVHTTSHKLLKYKKATERLTRYLEVIEAVTLTRSKIKHLS